MLSEETLIFKKVIWFSSIRTFRMNLRKNLNTKKLLPRYEGPFQVTEKVGKVAYKLGLPPSMSQLNPVFHV